MPLVSAGRRVTGGLLSLDYTQGDATVTTVTAATATQLSTAYTIPGGDAGVGTYYRLTAFGYGTWGSTQQALSLLMYFAGTPFGATIGIGSTTFSASASFRWQVRLLIGCATTGPAGTWTGSLAGEINESGSNIVPGNPATNATGFAQCPTSNTSRDTTVASALALYAQWAATTGAPTITCIGTLFEKLGG